MNSNRTSRWLWIAPLAALIATAGCASTKYDLSKLAKDVEIKETKALPEGLTHDVSQKSPRKSDVILAGAEIEESPRQSTRRSADRLAQRGSDVDRLTTPRSLVDRVEVPKTLPGAGTAKANLPVKDDYETEEAFKAANDEAIRRLFPSLSDPPAINSDPPLESVPKVTLFELEQLALANNPMISQAQANVMSASGIAIQAGTAPNPLVGYEADTVGSAGTRNYQGVFATQLIKTAGKLQVQQAIANVDLMNAQLALRNARYDVLTMVRRQYFALIVARESIKINESVVKFTHELYRVQVDQNASEISAQYKSNWLRQLSSTARTDLVKARNNYIMAWKQLTATLNITNYALADVVDTAELSPPAFDYDKAIATVSSTHTDVRTANNLPIRARLALRLAEITPIPDVNIYGTFQRDFTTPGLGRTTYNTQIGIPIPVFDQNKGNILAAKGALIWSEREVDRVQNELRKQLSSAYARFESARFLVGTQRDQILPDAVRTYRGTYQEHQHNDEKVGFADVVVAQQNFLTAIQIYLSALSEQWNAYVDVADLLQVDSLQELNLKLQERGLYAPPLDGTQNDRSDVPALVESMLLEDLPAVRPAANPTNET